MNFEDESYVRVYKRKTLTTKLVGWEGRAVLWHLFLEVDRAGVLDLDDHDPVEAVTAMTDLPIEIVRAGLERLFARGVVVVVGRALLIPKFLEAQEARQSDAQRQRESREKRRALVRLQELGVAAPPEETAATGIATGQEGDDAAIDSEDIDVTGRDTRTREPNDESRNVTEPSRQVTPSHSSSAQQCSTEHTNPHSPQGGEGAGADSAGSGETGETADDDTEPPEARAATEATARKVFEFWQREHGHTGAKFDRKRKAKIKARLREGFSGRELCVAIRAAKKDAHLMGENDRGRAYDGIETLLRDAAMVERLMELAGQKRGEPKSGTRLVAATAQPALKLWTPPPAPAKDPNPPPPLPPLPPRNAAQQAREAALAADRERFDLAASGDSNA